jgi:hypothetical protein
VLHPRRKLKYFKKNWSNELVEDIKDLAETIVSFFPQSEIQVANHGQFKQRYEQMHSNTPSGRRVERDDVDGSSGSDTDSDTEIDTARLWLGEFNRYFHTHDVVPEGMSIVEWWGVSVCILFICYVSDLNWFS